MRNEILASVALLWLALSVPAEAARLTLRNVHLIDARSSEAGPLRSLLIEDGRIAAILAADASTDGAVIDGAEGFVVPGLWDMHVHLQEIDAATLAQFIHYGVTQVRDMGSDPKTLSALAETASREGIAMPEVHASGYMLNSPRWKALFTQVYSPTDLETEMSRRLVVDSASAARLAVQQIAEAGGRFVKVHFWHDDPAVFGAIARAAATAGLPVAGHDPGPAFDHAALARLGIGSIEHLDGLLGHRMKDLDAAQRSAAYRGLADAGVHWTPTLSVIDGLVRMAEHEGDGPRSDILAAHPDGWPIDASLRAFWHKAERMLPPELPGWSIFQADLRRLREARLFGVQVMPGTDLGAPGVLPGYGLIRELKLMAKHLDMQPREVLASATLLPARWFGLETELGTLEPGKRANLLLLGANPLISLDAFEQINQVVLQGRLVERRHRQER